MSLSVIIPTIGRFESIKNLLDSIQTQTYLPSTVIIVDQSNDSRINELTLQFNFQIQYISLEIKSVNIARNIGLKHSISHEFTAILDDDLVLTPTYFEVLVKELQNNPTIHAAMGTMLNLSATPLSKWENLFQLPGPGDGQIWQSGFATTPHWKNKPSYCSFISAGLGVFRTKIICDAKFDENMKDGAIAEDVDLSARIGIENRIYYTPQAQCYHYHSSIARPNSYLMHKQYIQNTYYVGRKNRNTIHFSVIKFVISCIALQFRLLLNRDKRGVLGIINGLFNIALHRIDSIQRT